MKTQAKLLTPLSSRLFLLPAVLVTSAHGMGSSLFASRDHFKAWYPPYGGPPYGSVLQQNCSSEYHHYLTAPRHIPDCTSCYVQPVVNCLLRHTPEVEKANFASASVVLGLLPTILALVGPSTVETGLLAMRRPVLALLLSAGSPAVAPMRSFHYASPMEILETGKDKIDLPQLSGKTRYGVVMLQYLIACAAVANIAQVTWNFTYRTVLSISLETMCLPVIWVCLTVAVHIWGAMTLFLRIKLKADLGGAQFTFVDRVMQEFTPCSLQACGTIKLRAESYWFVFMSWLGSIGTMLLIVYGTMVYSSAIFIQVANAELVVGRYIISVAFCRIILMYEISGMRQKFRMEEL